MTSDHTQELTRSTLLLDMNEAERAQLETFFEHRSFADDAPIITEGSADRDLYILLRGRAKLVRRGVELLEFEAGDYFGELGLIVGCPRTATISALGAVEVMRMSPSDYGRLGESAPALTRKLLHAMIAGLGRRLSDMSDSVKLLLHERSLPRRNIVEARVQGVAQKTRTGTAIRALLPARVGKERVVAALLNRLPESLSTAISGDCTLVPVTTTDPQGVQIYRQSLSLLLLEAAHGMDPKLALRVGDSVGGGVRIIVENPPGAAALWALAKTLEAHMRALCAKKQPLRAEWWTADEACDHFRRRGWLDAVSLLRTWRQAAVALVSYGELYALSPGPLLPDTGELSDFRLAPVDGALVLVDEPESIALAEQSAEWQNSAMPPEQERWLDALRIESVGDFNQACVSGDVAEMIRVSEGFQEKRLSRIADEIKSRGDKLKIVCIAGPSSSGKTTFIKRLRVQLQVEGLNPKNLSLDDYYLDRELTPKDAHGELDFEALEALNLPRLQHDLARVLAGETVRTPRFDFVQGKSVPEGGPELTLGPRDLLMLEGIHGLNPALFQPARADSVFRVFVCPRAQLPFDRLNRVRASELRLLRRIVRDRRGRGTTPADNIMRWTSVRAGERKHIFPYQRHADAVFDSSLIYEMSVLKVYAERYLLEVPQDHAAYTTAFRLLALVDRFVAIYPDHVPPTSFLREFIGGSGFEY